MKKALLAAGLGMTLATAPLATAAFAQTAQTSPQVITAHSSSSEPGFLVPTILVLLVLLAISTD